MATIQDIKNKINNLITDGNLAAGTEFDNLTDVINALKGNQGGSSGGIEINSLAWKRIFNKDYTILTAANYGVVETNIESTTAAMDFNGIVDFKANNLTALPAQCFEECRYLASVNAPKVTQINERAFYNCIKLNKIVLAEELNKIGAYGFYGTPITEIDLKNVTILENSTFSYCSSLKKLIARNVTTINTGCFSSSKKMEYLFFPSLTTITGGQTLDYSDTIFNLLLPGDVIPVTNSSYFFGYGSLSATSHPNIWVKDELVDSYKTATNWSKFASYIYPISSYEGEIITCL
jgi:hypothetical protein